MSLNLETFRRRSEHDTIFKISRLIKRTRFEHCRISTRRPGPINSGAEAGRWNVVSSRKFHSWILIIMVQEF